MLMASIPLKVLLACSVEDGIPIIGFTIRLISARDYCNGRCQGESLSRHTSARYERSSSGGGMVKAIAPLNNVPKQRVPRITGVMVGVVFVNCGGRGHVPVVEARIRPSRITVKTGQLYCQCRNGGILRFIFVPKAASCSQFIEFCERLARCHWFLDL